MRLWLLFPLACWGAGFDHSGWNSVLAAHVNELGEVNYAALRRDPVVVNEYAAALARTSPLSSPSDFPTRNHQLAYWINAYNALVVHSVVAAYPVSSVTAVGAKHLFFRQRVHTVGGRTMSLDDIEHGIIRKRFAEPRIHFALVCAAVSCPRLQREAYDGDRLEQQLARATREFLAEPRNLVIEPGRNEVTLTRLFYWYGRDFNSLRAFLARHVPSFAALDKPRLRYFPYDWSLNEPGSRSRSVSPLEREFAGAGKGT